MMATAEIGKHKPPSWKPARGGPTPPKYPNPPALSNNQKSIINNRSPRNQNPPKIKKTLPERSLRPEIYPIGVYPQANPQLPFDILNSSFSILSPFSLLHSSFYILNSTVSLRPLWLKKLPMFPNLTQMLRFKTRQFQVILLQFLFILWQKV